MDCIATHRRRQQVSKIGRRSGSNKAEFGLVPIQLIPVKQLLPSPENDSLYRPFDPADPENVELARSIKANGVQEPLIGTTDYYVISGHRRLAAAKLAGLVAVPCKILDFRKNDDHDRFMRLLRECNRQRVKTFDEKLREEVVSANPKVAYQALIEHRKKRSRLVLDTFDIRGEKRRAEISLAKRPFLNAIKKIIHERREFWPLSDRQIHYALLNAPPLIHASKSSSMYANNPKSYKALTELLTRARIAGEIPLNVIQDATRPVTLWDIHADVQSFIRHETAGFCKNYWRDLLKSQPNHIEIVGEKNTIEPIIRSVAAKYCVPMTIGRGYCSLRPRHDIAERYRKSGKECLVLMILSDHDPDGEEISHSLARSLRDDFGVEKIEPIKVALTSEQVEGFDLPPMLEAKQTSAQYKRFVGKYGKNCWELEALPPETLQRVLQDAIDRVIDVEAFNQEIDREQADAAELEGVRRIVLETLGQWRGKE